MIQEDPVERMNRLVNRLFDRKKEPAETKIVAEDLTLGGGGDHGKKVGWEGVRRLDVDADPEEIAA
jgi:hypothetical protein